ncbi:amino acid ABC transporter ATP-binding protein [Deferribacterales bacterium RsTz2092]|nr:putative amino-acid import ATP-binding protein YxeO [Deferribacterales bacterium]
MIEIKGLSKKFNNRQALADVSLEVLKGEVLSIIGHSGSGKSTLLRCLNFLEKPDAGEIRIDEVRLNATKYSSRDEIAIRRQSAMVFQSYNLFRNKTALENVTESLIYTKGFSKADARALGLELLERVGLLPQAAQYPITLSGGQQQRVAIARALAVDPKVILFDEPTSALDPELINEVLDVIQNLAREKTTMIIVTHEMEFARKVSDHVIFMADGQVVERGSARQLFERPSDERTRRFLRQTGEIEEYVI